MKGHAKLLHALAAVCALATGSADASPVIAVNQPWLRPAAARETTEAYFAIASSEPVSLVDAHSPAATSVSIRAPRPGAHKMAALAVPDGLIKEKLLDNTRVIVCRTGHPLAGLSKSSKPASAR